MCRTDHRPPPGWQLFCARYRCTRVDLTHDPRRQPTVSDFAKEPARCSST
ncbi:hypothetical protein I553_5822 [Mycobacterium xenopi 4042]|uniref:Uncharacterized protein n=1 Tax=Mycobacterium xenopi 4042 TaxID=1299334 RepID=X7ZVN6_MYCXE|nr:hypothetical protein I553_5822 [Mycobacterium xenopi 4042]EUA24799.1 hypothetical protein I552_3203 [Mycobacterium xenopi 3993]